MSEITPTPAVSSWLELSGAPTPHVQPTVSSWLQLSGNPTLVVQPPVSSWLQLAGEPSGLPRGASHHVGLVWQAGHG